jgi:hypothetical protein
MIRRLAPLALAPVLATLLLAGCGGGSSGPSIPTIGAAKTYGLADFAPAGALRPGKPTTISFVIRQPDGQPLTKFKRGPGPHTGVHLILVRDDLSAIVHKHPPVAEDGTIRQTLTLAPGRYRMVVDAYPAPNPNDPGQLPNFQLFKPLRVSGRATNTPLPPPATTVDSDGYHFAIEGKPKLKAIQAALLNVDVTGPDGKPAKFTPYYGALAHAIFFRRGSLDYFHTHVCAPGAQGCTSILGGAQVTGTSSRPGRLTVGVLVPAPGTWRLFLQTKVGGHVVTAPFTLVVH